MSLVHTCNHKKPLIVPLFDHLWKLWWIFDHRQIVSWAVTVDCLTICFVLRNLRIHSAVLRFCVACLTYSLFHIHQHCINIWLWKREQGEASSAPNKVSRVSRASQKEFSFSVNCWRGQPAALHSREDALWYSDDCVAFLENSSNNMLQHFDKFLFFTTWFKTEHHMDTIMYYTTGAESLQEKLWD